MRRHLFRSGVGVALVAIGLVVAPGAVGDIGSACSVHGAGRLAAGDTFAGEAREIGDSEDAKGHWTHRAPDGTRLKGDVEFSSCRADGGGPPAPPPGTEANLVDLSGTGTWDGASVVWRVHAEDRGEPAERDYYSLTVFDEDETLVYFADGFLESGNIQLRCHAHCG